MKHPKFEKYLRHENGKLYWTNRPSQYGKNKIGSRAEYKKVDGYLDIKFMHKQYKAHRIVWYLHYGKMPTKDLDHINGIKNDNRIENLREVDNRENQNNRLKHRLGHLVGVSKRKKRKKNHSQKFSGVIRLNRKSYHLGNFDSIEEAHISYLLAKEMLYDEL